MCLAPLIQPERAAPKGQEIEPRLACRRPFARSICRPFRARRLGTGFPGLKPRAESSRPLWGEEVSQIPLIFVPFSPQLRLCCLKKEFEQEHEHDNEYDLGKSRIKAT
jgi:hypothetical protein